MKKIRIILFLLLGIFVFVPVLRAQITTCAISGRVTGNDGEALPGAVILITHLPSGSVSRTVTNTNGWYHVEGLRAGGPYTLKASYLGYQPTVYTQINLQLGNRDDVNIEMKGADIELKNLVVTGNKSSARTGTSTQITSRQLTTVPTLNRSISDFTKLSPYAGRNNTFAGRDGRYNYVSIDGAPLNDNFGLSSNYMPGGNAQPISLDVLENIRIDVAPFDVKYSNFTGAAVNAVTKSGTNDFSGTAYGYFRPKSFSGKSIDGIDIPNAQTRHSELYGITLGGPIIKNKLFFFINGEIENESYPGVQWRPSEDGVGDVTQKISRTSAGDMKRMSDFLQSQYGYSTGKYNNFDNFSGFNWKIMARVDWNINLKNKLTLRYNGVQSKNDDLVNSSSFGGYRDSRVGDASMAFENSNFKYKNKVMSVVGELNSQFTPFIFNKFLATYSYVNDTREIYGSPFPFVDIDKNGKQYMSFGSEIFTPGNDVTSKVLSFIDNVTFSLDDHYLTAGISFDKYAFRNAYMRYAWGYYRYASMEDFMNNAKPTAFALTYGYNGREVPYADLDFGMGAVYVQDEWSIGPLFKLNYGLRLDLPFYMNDLPDNQAVSELRFADNRQIDVSKWPKSKLLFSPRVAFTYDVLKDHSLMLKGGTGIFTGVLPFVWFTNQPANSGYLQNKVELTANQLPDNFRFNTDYREVLKQYPDLLASTPTTQAPGSVCFVDPKFKMPQVWRSSLSIEWQLPYDFMLSANAMYTRDIYNVVQNNVNEKPATDKFAGNDNRDYWPAKDNRINKNISDAMMLTNGNEKGYQYSFNVELIKKFASGFSGSVSYTYSQAKDLTANPGSVAKSSWQYNVAVNSLNNPGLSYSSFSIPHRIIAQAMYEISYLKHFKTTVALLYQASPIGRMSYIYPADLNGDGVGSDLMYVPSAKDELLFKDITDNNNNVTFSADEQREVFWNYINNDSYLKSRKGKYTERFGCVMPWVHRFDFKIMQDFNLNIGSRRYGLQVSLDILNVGNLFNSGWGVEKANGLASFGNIRLLKTAGVTADKKPVYQVNAANKALFEKNARWSYDISSDNTWGMMLGVRLSF